MNIIEYTEYQSPVGELIIGSFDGEICLINWKYRKMRQAIDKRICQGLQAEMRVVRKNPVNLEAIAWLDAYFAGESPVFRLPLKFLGTAFQLQVWAELMKIKRGETSTYMELATLLDNPGAVRAVAAANGANAISIVVPCHRVLGSNGELVGYAGGLPAKKKLLELEGAFKRTGQLSLF